MLPTLVTGKLTGVDSLVIIVHERKNRVIWLDYILLLAGRRFPYDILIDIVLGDVQYN